MSKALKIADEEKIMWGTMRRKGVQAAKRGESWGKKN